MGWFEVSDAGNYKNSEKKSGTIFGLMEELDDEINDIVSQLAEIQAEIEKKLNVASISKKIVDLSHTDPLNYNLELNRIGNKIILKNKELSFSLEEDNVVARFKFSQYDRKRKAYQCVFYGSKEYYIKSEYVTEVRTSDWDIDRLMNPHKIRGSSVENAARVMYYHKIHSESGYLDILLRDD